MSLGMVMSRCSGPSECIHANEELTIVQPHFCFQKKKRMLTSAICWIQGESEALQALLVHVSDRIDEKEHSFQDDCTWVGTS